MKILLTADVHFGYPQKLHDILWALRSISEYASNSGIEIIVVMGDLFHDRVNLNIEVYNAAYNFFEEAKKSGQTWICFPGNHDLYLRHSWRINSLHSLNKVVTVVENIKLLKLYGRRFWILPFVHYETVYMKALRKIEEQYQDGDVLLTHVGVHNATLNECFLIKNWSVVNFDDSKFDRVFTGHFHCHQKVEGRGNVWYPGSPIPFRFDEGMVPHGFIEYDVDSRQVGFVEIFGLNLTPGPRPADYVTLVDDMLEEKLYINGDNVRVRLNRDYAKDELTRIRSSLLEQGALNVKFQMVREEKIDLAAESKSDISLSSPVDLFEKWMKHDRPKKLDFDLLKNLNAEIVDS